MGKTLILRDCFGRFTGLRHHRISEKSGEEFYHDHLNEAFKNAMENDVVLTVDLDGVRGYSPSFIDEAFGNLIYDFELKNVQKYLKIKSDDLKLWEDRIKSITFVLWEQKRLNQEIPTKTTDHKPWFRFQNNSFISNIWIHPQKHDI